MSFGSAPRLAPWLRTAAAAPLVLALSLAAHSATAAAQSPTTPVHQGILRAAPPVTTAAALAAAVAAAPASGTTTIALAPGFPALTASLVLTVPNGATVELVSSTPGTPVEIKKTPNFTGAAFDIRGGAGSAITLDEFAFTGPNAVNADGSISTSIASNGVTFTSSAAGGLKPTVKNSVFQGYYGQAIKLIGPLGPVLVDGSSFIGNTALDSGAAIQSGTNNPLNLVVTNSTFDHNTVAGPNWPGGAISVKGGTGTSRISNSSFTNNGAVARGGAVSFEQYQGTVSIDHSYFEGNTNNADAAATQNSTQQSRVDGGAVAVSTASAAQVCTVTVDSSTFVNNTAFDEAGALFIETYSQAALIRNSTFVGNSSANRQTSDLSDGGGAVEISLTTATFEHNTFYDNTALRGNLFIGTSQNGGAVTSNQPASAFTFKNNIFVGNNVTNSAGSPVSSKYANVYSAKGVIDQGGNLGLDNNTTLPADLTVESVFGTTTPALGTHQVKSTVGDPRWAAGSTFARALTTLPILISDPTGAVHGKADNATTTTLAVDERGFARDPAKSDIGAYEDVWLRFDANGGHWGALGPLSYDGTAWYDDTATEVTDYYLVANHADVVGPHTAPTTGPTPSSRFAGWNTAADGGGLSPFDATGTYTLDDDTIVYAQWESCVTVRFELADGTTVAEPVELCGSTGSGYTTQAATVASHTLRETPANATGVYGTDIDDVVYIYTKDTTPIDPGDEDDPVVDPPADSSPPDTSHPAKASELPVTGADTALAVAFAGLLTALGGLALMARRRRGTD